MYSLDIKRCVHCVGALKVVPLSEEHEFEHPAPAVVCTYCDASPRWDQAVFVPRRWHNPLG